MQHALPGAHEVEAAELLGQVHRLVDDPLLLLVVAHFLEAGQREVLAQGMALEAIVGEDAAQIGMVREEDAEHVPHLALQPRSEEHTSELQSLMRISYAVFCLKKKQRYHNQLHCITREKKHAERKRQNTQK